MSDCNGDVCEAVHHACIESRQKTTLFCSQLVMGGKSTPLAVFYARLCQMAEH